MHQINNFQFDDQLSTYTKYDILYIYKKKEGSNIKMEQQKAYNEIVRYFMKQVSIQYHITVYLLYFVFLNDVKKHHATIYTIMKHIECS